MYTQPQKRFNLKPQAEIERELAGVAAAGVPVRRIFLADGDAMTLSTRRLMDYIESIRKYYPEVQRISSYCLPRNLKNKTAEELAELRALGLDVSEEARAGAFSRVHAVMFDPETGAWWGMADPDWVGSVRGPARRPGG